MTIEKLSMKAVLPEIDASNATNMGGEKETVSTLSVVGKVNGRLKVVVEARFYMGRSRSASSVYCSLWVKGDKYTSGRGTAGGYGYHKESEALASAISSAGIELYGANHAFAGDKKINFKSRAHIGGCGSSGMETALKAIARAAGARGALLIS